MMVKWLYYCLIFCPFWYYVEYLLVIIGLRLVIMYFAAISQLQELALSLSLKCLSFDFVGTSVDESSDEFGTVQVSACLNIFINFVFGSTISFLLCWFIYYPVIWWFADSISLETSFGRFFNATTIF